MKHFVDYKILFFFILLLSSCSLTKVTIKDLELQPYEAIFVGKIIAVDKDSVVIDNCNINIDDKFYTSIDESNFVYFKIPIGEHFFTKIETYNNSLTLFPYDTLFFNCDSAGIYYLGDIKIYWNKYSSFFEIFGSNILGLKNEPLRKKRSKDIPKKINIDVIDNFELTTKSILKKIDGKNNVIIQKSILIVK